MTPAAHGHQAGAEEHCLNAPAARPALHASLRAWRLAGLRGRAGLAGGDTSIQTENDSSDRKFSV
jgi:hypothetical protein